MRIVLVRHGKPDGVRTAAVLGGCAVRSTGPAAWRGNEMNLNVLATVAGARW
jgi:hypothetical protein